MEHNKCPELFIIQGTSGPKINFPYASDIANAASNTNTGVPGKYIMDMNGKYADC